MNDPNSYSPNPYQPMPAHGYRQVACHKPKIPLRERLSFLGVSLFFYLAALFTSAVVFQGEDDTTWPGFEVLVSGWMGALYGQFGWFANIPLLIGIILLLCRRWIGTMVCIGLAILLALNSFLLYWQKIPTDEAGTYYRTLNYLGAGFYWWLFSMVLVGVSAVILRQRERSLALLPHRSYNLPPPQPPHQHL